MNYTPGDSVCFAVFPSSFVCAVLLFVPVCACVCMRGRFLTGKAPQSVWLHFSFLCRLLLESFSRRYISRRFLLGICCKE
jgi:hypothetical protein